MRSQCTFLAFSNGHYTGCDRIFTTVSGRTQHMQRAHHSPRRNQSEAPQATAFHIISFQLCTYPRIICIITASPTPPQMLAVSENDCLRNLTHPLVMYIPLHHLYHQYLWLRLKWSPYLTVFEILPNYVMCGVNLSRISRTFTDATLREVINSIAVRTRTLLGSPKCFSHVLQHYLWSPYYCGPGYHGSNWRRAMHFSSQLCRSRLAHVHAIQYQPVRRIERRHVPVS